MFLARFVLKNIVVHGHKLSLCYFILGIILCTIKIDKSVTPLSNYDFSAVTGPYNLKYDYYEKGPQFLMEIIDKGITSIDQLFDHAADFMRDTGLTVYRQNFTFSDPTKSGIPRQNSSNLVGLLRAQRDKNIGTLVVYLMLRGESSDGLSVGLLQSLVYFFSEGTMWSKNIIFVLGQQGTLGVQAFVDGYSRSSRSQYISADTLPISFSDVHLGIFVDIENSTTSSLRVDHFGMNGRLVLSDVMVVISWIRHKMISSIFEIFNYPQNWQETSTNALSFIWHQLTASAANQPHSVFLNVGVPAITLSHKNVNGEQYPLQNIGKNIENLMISGVAVPYKQYFPYSFYIMTSSTQYIPMYIYSKVVGILMIPICMQCIIIAWSFKCLKISTTWAKYNSVKFEDDVIRCVTEIGLVLVYAVCIALVALHREILPHVLFSSLSKMVSDEVIILLISLLIPIIARFALGRRLGQYSCRILGAFVLLAYCGLLSLFISTHMGLYLLVVSWGSVLVLLFSRQVLLRLVGRFLFVFTCPPICVAMGALLNHVFVRGWGVDSLLSGGLSRAVEVIDLAGVLNEIYKEYVLYGNYAYLFLSICAWPLFAVQLAICLIGSFN